MRVLDIIQGTSVDGPGLRTSVYVSGCQHQCPGCHNPQSWDMHGGAELTIDQIMQPIAEAGFNVTISGGDPLYQMADTLALAKACHDAGLTVWLYTGFTIEQIKADARLRPILMAVDVIVDGPYIAAQRDTTLPFRGSANQRIVYLNENSDTPYGVSIDSLQ